ncbi:enoyl-CoA hydratase/isomerase family protein, partial [Mycobacterium sp.]|uniref:enoyl-CoA hydratase/isomerase family protein n=1 Tax=Mycobacterium sp. TaxID=1785 RepID=UPI003C70C312
MAAYLTMNDPARRNALSDALLDQLSASLQRAAADPRVRVVVLTSSHPRIFSSGGNL